jgi:hypothetical protein
MTTAPLAQTVAALTAISTADDFRAWHRALVVAVFARLDVLNIELRELAKDFQMASRMSSTRQWRSQIVADRWSAKDEEARLWQQLADLSVITDTRGQR